MQYLLLSEGRKSKYDGYFVLLPIQFSVIKSVMNQANFKTQVIVIQLYCEKLLNIIQNCLKYSLNNFKFVKNINILAKKITPLFQPTELM